jgi:uncharacterized protein YbjQ (UPF0145 family)
MLITSESGSRGAGDIKRLGNVTGEYEIPEKTFRGIIAEMSKYDEIRSDEYEKELDKAKQAVMGQMQKKAESLGANAIIGVSMHQEITSFGTLMVITGTGTAAVIEDLEE